MTVVSLDIAYCSFREVLAGLDTRLDTPPSIDSHHPDSGLARTQQGTKLIASGAVSVASQGSSVALSAAGNTAVIGGRADNSYTGAAWVFVQPVPSLQVRS